ncbi:MAG: biotin synthase BioB [Verrucomicrobiota bacterium]|nr:biotin synthase BioB [Verrucomicrobiota bacterium]
MINKHIMEAYRILEGSGEGITQELAFKIGQDVKGEDILDLLSLANKVRNKFTNGIHICSIINAKSGICPENCRFCAQSAHHNVEIESYDLMKPETILEQANIAYKNGVNHFGIVTSGTGYQDVNDEFIQILKTVDLIKERCDGMKICASIGILSDKTARLLAEKEIAHYNINLQTAPSKYAELIANTHTVDDKIKTVKLLQKYGIKVCCGGIIGVGETLEDDIEMAFAIKDLDVDGIPLNVLIPIAGTPLEREIPVPTANIAKIFSLFRLINPSKTIKFAAGRETKMKDFQGLLMLAGANGMLTGGYLTTRGRKTSDDILFINELKNF